MVRFISFFAELGNERAESFVTLVTNFQFIFIHFPIDNGDHLRIEISLECGF